MFDVCDNVIYIYTSILKAPRLTFHSTITVEESYDKVGNLYYSITTVSYTHLTLPTICSV